jgi:hypothetical protein
LQPIQNGERAILDHTYLQHETLQLPILRQEANTQSDRFARGPRRDRLAVQEDRAATSAQAEWSRSELAAARVNQASNPEHLAPAQFEGNVMQLIGG